MIYLDLMTRSCEITDFCLRLNGLGLSNTNASLAILWFLHRKLDVDSATSGELARYIKESGLGNPNSTKLRESLMRSKRVLVNKGRLRLKPTSFQPIQDMLATIISPEPPRVPETDEFISHEVWSSTRGYIEKVAAQINGCYYSTYYDGASVLCRKLTEILLIEAFEKEGRSDEIKDGAGEYMMMSGLIDVALQGNGLQLGRETKKILRQIKSVGDRSAHNRRYIAVKGDLDNLKLGFRLVIDELLHLACLK